MYVCDVIIYYLQTSYVAETPLLCHLGWGWVIQTQACPLQT